MTSSAFLFVPFVIGGLGVGGEVLEGLAEGARMISMTLPRRVSASGEISVLGGLVRGILVGKGWGGVWLGGEK